MYLQFDRTQTIGIWFVGGMYWFATGQLLGCVIITLILWIFISIRKV